MIKAMGAAGGAAVLVLSLYLVPAAAAPPEAAGKALIVSPSGNKPLGSGGSASAFSLRLPTGASCQGDSADDNYRVQSYMVPADDDPGALNYTAEGPEGPGRFPLYDVTTSPFVNEQTANAESSGEPGIIADIATFSFGVYGPGELPAGRYNVGIACSLLNKTTRFWNVETVLTSAPGDKPAQIRWTVPGVSAQASNYAIPGAAVLAAALLVALAGALLVRRLRSGGASPSPTPLEEE